MRGRGNRVHVIVSNYNKPYMDRIEFLEQVRADPVTGKTVFIMRPDRPTARS